MIVNGYSILDAFLVALRLVIATFVIWFGFTGWWKIRTDPSRETRRSLEGQYYLLFLLTFLQLGLTLFSWPMLYLVLQSYVKEWPDVMCIYGVTQIGLGSEGISRFLPAILSTLQTLKPLAVFLSGVWFVLYLANRKTATASLTRPVFGAILILGAVVAVDAALEASYLAIPKKERFLSVGCCAVALNAAESSRFLPTSLLPSNSRPWLYLAYYGSNLAMMAALSALLLAGRQLAGVLTLIILCVGAVGLMAVNAVFLVEIAAPRLLHLPYHHCAYDLVFQVPESAVAIGMFFFGVFALGWALVVRWCGRTAAPGEILRLFVRRLVAGAAIALFCSMAMTSVELVLSSLI